MKLAAVGSNCVDFYNNIENGKAYPGGSPVNVAVYTVRLGGEGLRGRGSSCLTGLYRSPGGRGLLYRPGGR